MGANLGFGRFILAAGIVGLGATVAVFGDAALVWEAKAAAHQAALADVAGVGLLVIGIGLIAPRPWARVAAGALALLLALKILLLCLPAVIRDPTTELNWYAPAEALALAAGPLVLARLGARMGRITRCAFGLALIPIGLSHLVYLALTASLVPAWAPFRPAWAVVTGVCHLAAGAAILVGVVPRLAAKLEAAMMSLFTVMVWIPAAIAKPALPGNWSELCLSAALSGAAWLVAEKLTRPEGRQGAVAAGTPSAARVNDGRRPQNAAGCS